MNPLGAARTGAVAEKILADIRGAVAGQKLGDVDGMGAVGGGALLKGLAGVARLAAGLASGVFASQGFGFAL